MHLTAHLMVPDAAAASEWYGRAFGAVERNRVPLPGGKVMTVELVLGDSTFSVASEFPQAGIVSPLTVGGTSSVVQINTDDADALWERALESGARVRHELGDQFWGERHGQLTDPFGHNWNIAQRIRDVTSDEVNAAAARAFGGTT